MIMEKRLHALLSAAAIALGLWGPDFSLQADWLFLGTVLGVDGINRPFLIVTGLAWLTAGLLSRPTDGGMTRFTAAFWLAFVGNVLTVLSRDIVTFYISFAVMSVAAYGLLAHAGGPRSRFAGRVYIVMAIAGELLLFAAMVGLVHLAGGPVFPIEPAGSLPAWVTLCVLAGFGIKAGLVPLHVSLPLIYRAAPLAGGVALAGAALNAGILGWIRWLPAEGAESWSGWMLVALGLGGYLYAVTVGLCQRHPRALLGYSSVSQVALMAVVIGAAVIVPDSRAALVAGVLVMMLNHAVAKTFLFAISGPRQPTRFVRALVWAGVVVAGAALAGAPLTGGYAAKSVLGDAVAGVPGIELAAGGLWITSALTAVLVARFAWLLARSPVRPAAASSLAGVLASFSPLAVLTLTAAAKQPWPASALVVSAMPILGALTAAWWIGRQHRLPAIPAGDVAVPVARALGELGRLFQRVAASAGRGRPRGAPGRGVALPDWIQRSANAPDPGWSGAAVAVMACLVVIGACLVWLTP